MKIYLGNKNYSTWSLRPWLVLRHFEIACDEEMALLSGEGWKAHMRTLSPGGTVPVLVDGDLVLWDSLAIIEYLADQHPDLAIWPRDVEARAKARVLASAMHSGFSQLRTHAPMNLRKAQHGALAVKKVSDDLALLETMLGPELARSEGAFLFGEFSAVDAMYAPLAARIETYDLPVSAPVRAYVDALLSLPAFLTWKIDALKEPWVLAMDEIDGSANGLLAL